jgi:hypothetical protein
MNFTINKWHLYWDNNDKIREENEKIVIISSFLLWIFFIGCSEKKRC